LVQGVIKFSLHCISRARAPPTHRKMTAVIVRDQSVLQLTRNVALSAVSLGVCARAFGAPVTSNSGAPTDDDDALQDLLRRASVFTTEALQLLEAMSRSTVTNTSVHRAKVSVAALLGMVKSLPRVGPAAADEGLAAVCAEVGATLRELNEVTCGELPRIDRVGPLPCLSNVRLSGCASSTQRGDGEWSKEMFRGVTSSAQLPDSALAALHVGGLSTSQIESNLAAVLFAFTYDENEFVPPTVNDGCTPSFILNDVESQLVIDKYVFLGAAGLVSTVLVVCLSVCLMWSQTHSTISVDRLCIKYLAVMMAAVLRWWRCGECLRTVKRTSAHSSRGVHCMRFGSEGRDVFVRRVCDTACSTASCGRVAVCIGCANFAERDLGMSVVAVCVCVTVLCAQLVGERLNGVCLGLLLAIAPLPEDIVAYILLELSRGLVCD
jgi:hypothetical protein